MAGEMIEIAAEKSVNSYLARPDGQVKVAVIVIHEVWGLTDHIKSVAERLAAAGYLALAPDLLGGTGIDQLTLAGLQNDLFDPEKRNQVQPDLRQLMAPMQNAEFGELTTQRLQACFDYLFNLPETQNKVAVAGFCFGGTYSFNLAIKEPRLKLALPFYGHADQTSTELKNIACPIFAFYGEKDERLMAQLPDLEKRMSESGVNFQSKVYPDCGHAFFNDSNPFAYNAAAAADAWQRTLQLLEKI